MKNTILLSALILALGSLATPANGAEILWSQYCQHLGKMKLLVHLDTDPSATTGGESEPVKLWLREQAEEEWKLADTRPVDPLTATSLFVLDSWPRHTRTFFKVTCCDSEWEGIFRAEPKGGSVLKAAGLSCHKDVAWPWKEAIAEVISHDPDLVIFTAPPPTRDDARCPDVGVEKAIS